MTQDTAIDLRKGLSKKAIKVLGPGCNSARNTATLIREVAAARQVEIDLEEVFAPERIAALGVTRTPAIMVDGVIVLEGGVPDWIDVENWLANF